MNANDSNIGNSKLNKEVIDKDDIHNLEDIKQPLGRFSLFIEYFA